MRYKLLTGFTLVVMVVLLVTTGARQSPARADVVDTSVLAGMPSLDSYQIYFSEANKEASRFDRSELGLSRLAGLLQRLDAELYTLEWRKPIPPEADLVIIAGPLSDLGAEQVVRLWYYVINGGRVLLLAEPPFDESKAFRAGRGLFELTWVDMGIEGHDDVVSTEGEPHTMTVTGDMLPVPADATPGPTITPYEAQVPTLITTVLTGNVNGSHPILNNVTGELAFFDARSLEVDTSLQPYEVTPLVYAGDNYYGETGYADYLTTGYADYSPDTDIARGEVLLAAASVNTSTNARLVVIGDREFATNGGGLQTSPPNSPSFLYPGNAQFLLNAIAWLLEAEAEAVNIPTPGPTSTAVPTPTVQPES